MYTFRSVKQFWVTVQIVYIYSMRDIKSRTVCASVYLDSPNGKKAMD
jgi:hypothetical protein